MVILWPSISGKGKSISRMGKRECRDPWAGPELGSGAEEQGGQYVWSEES